jgi:hypothetical protein
MSMKISKSQALSLWNGSSTAMARAIGNSLGAVSMWREVLTPQQTDRVIAAAWRNDLLHRLEQFRNDSSVTPVGVDAPVVGDERVGDGDER